MASMHSFVKNEAERQTIEKTGYIFYMTVENQNFRQILEANNIHEADDYKVVGSRREIDGKSGLMFINSNTCMKAKILFAERP